MARSRVEINPRLRRTLQRLPLELTAENKKAVAEEAQILREYMVGTLAQVGAIDDGDLLRSINVRIGSNGLSAEVGPGAKANQRDRRWFQSLARWIEYGTRPHSTSKGASLKSWWREQKLSRRQHPGTPARPFVIPAFEARKNHMIRRLAETTRKTLQKVSGGS